MAEQAYTEHRYGRHGGTTKVKPSRTKGQPDKYRSTQSAMSDKMRYNVTRFEGESNTVHTDDGGETTDHQSAYTYVVTAAEQIQETSRLHRAYIYDTTLSPGGRLTDEQAALMVDAYCADMGARGYAVQGMSYVTHQNTNNTHVHMMYATQKTIQDRDNRGNKREMAQEADRVRTPDQLREWQAQQVRQQAQKTAARQQRSHTTDDHDRGR